MRRIISSILFVVLVSIALYAKPVDLTTAQKVAVNFANANTKSNSIESSDEYKVSKFPNENNPRIYIFEKKTGDGFILVSADDVALPVLAYSNESKLSLTKSNIASWVTSYSEQIDFAVAKTRVNTATLVLWEEAIAGTNKSNRIASPNALSPLLQTKWDQAPFYNDKCPANGSGRAVTGCVATAMAQVMKYWSYPKKGVGTYNYVHSNYGTLSANFGNTNYDWVNMPNVVSGKNEAVAILMYHCGVAVDMDYSAESSGSNGGVLVAPALINYFGYPQGTKFENRDDFSKTNWINKLKTELDLNRPLYYEGIGKSGGHAFVFDGYDNNNFFHVNWGWSGNSDGYFNIDALAPADLGTGGGAGGFNYNQGAIFGMYVQTAPPPAINKLTLTTPLLVDPRSIDYYGEFSVSGNVKNETNAKFDGKIAAVLFNFDGLFVSFIDSLDVSLNANQSLQSGFTLGTTGMAAAAPGEYLIAIFSKTANSNWTAVEDGSFSNISEFTVNSADVPLKLWDSIQVYQNSTDVTKTIIDGSKGLTVRYDVGNFGDTDYIGDFTIDLYSVEGDWIKELGKQTNIALPADSHFTNGISFDVPIMGVGAGDYLLIAWYKGATDADYVMIGTNYYQNPVPIKVSAPSILPDTYEENNFVTTANRRTLSYDAGTKKGFMTIPNANLHKGSDVDHYVFALPNNLEFNLKAYLIDKDNNSAAGVVDAAFTYILDNIESDDVYDSDTLDMKITKSTAARDMYIKVFPAFSGLVGNYEVRVAIEAVITDVQEADILSEISLFPNPTDRFLNIEAESIKKIEVLDGKGSVVFTTQSEIIKQLDLQNLASGRYYLKLYSSDNSIPVISKSIVIAR